MFKKSKIIVGAALLAVSVLSFTLPQQAEAINLGSIAGKAVGAAKEQQEINKALNYYDNEGRHELFEALKQEDGVNSDYNANAMLGRIMQRMTPAIAKSDATINSKPYNYFVNNQEFFNAYCALGHNMSVNIGAFWFLDYNEDKLAAVIAHELVHGQKEHPIKGAKKKMSVDFVMKTVHLDHGHNGISGGRPQAGGEQHHVYARGHEPGHCFHVVARRTDEGQPGVRHGFRVIEHGADRGLAALLRRASRLDGIVQSTFSHFGT